MNKLNDRDLELEDESMLSRGDAVNKGTLKGYRINAPQTTKLTPLRK